MSRNHTISGWGAWTAILIAALGASCSDSSGPPPQPVVTPVDQATAGSITATVTFDGAVPAPVEINMRAAGRCAELHAKPVYNQPVQVSENKLADVLVYIKSGLGDRKFHFPTEPATINQSGCLYHPRVGALMVGQPLLFVNSDPLSHNVRGRPKKIDAWNFMMSRPQSTRTVYFDQPEIGIRIGCDIHPWMQAYVSVLDHPYFGITNEAGEVRLTNIPPGDYVIGTWHETLGTREQSLTVPPHGDQILTFEY